MDKDKIHVISLSGGKDSTAMLLMMIEKGMKIDRIVFVDTTKEYPPLYEHLKKLQEYIKPYEIETIKMDWDYWFFEHDKTKSSRKGKYKNYPGYGWAHWRGRWCTALKTNLFRNYIAYDKYTPKERNTIRKGDYDHVIEYHGIAYDERERVRELEDREIRYPLVEWGITEQQALEYCYSKGFDWDGLYEIFPRASCWCCPFQQVATLKKLYKEYPDLWEEMVDMDKRTHVTFHHGRSVEYYDKRFKKE